MAEDKKRTRGVEFPKIVVVVGEDGSEKRVKVKDAAEEAALKVKKKKSWDKE